MRRTLEKIERHIRSQWSKKLPTWAELSGLKYPPAQPGMLPVRPGVVRQSDCLSPDFFYWMTALKESPTLERKKWEWFLGLQTLHVARGADWSGLRAVGFGVGIEPIPDLLASRGVSVLATDWREGAEASAWQDTNQLSEELTDLNRRQISDPATFASKVAYRDVDMNNIPRELHGQFDFVFSFCSLGHIGGYRQGLDFIRESAHLLAPGGVSQSTQRNGICRRVNR